MDSALYVQVFVSEMRFPNTSTWIHRYQEAIAAAHSRFGRPRCREEVANAIMESGSTGDEHDGSEVQESSEIEMDPADRGWLWRAS